MLLSYDIKFEYLKNGFIQLKLINARLFKIMFLLIAVLIAFHMLKNVFSSLAEWLLMMT